MKDLLIEKKYLEKTIKTINNNIASNFLQIEELKKVIEESKNELTINYREMDNEELYRESVNIDENKDTIQVVKKDILKKEKQLSKPYFARIDFKSESLEKIYIGLGNIKEKGFLVYDWRAPVSSLYYDYDLGKASYSCEDGVFDGEITLKRQFNITDQKLNFYVDTNQTINDEILQQVLSNNTSSKMKEIISTIQKTQNQLIREDFNKNIIVQGVAGSGKTSVALHRAGYLLYKNKNNIKSEDILTLSPSSLFSNYISDVLPQMGEDNVVETTFLSVAKSELSKSLQERPSLIDELCEKKSQKEMQAVAFKSSFSFLEEIIDFLKKTYSKTFRPQNMVFKDLEKDVALFVFTKEEIEHLYFNSYKDLDVHKRINYISEYLIERFNLRKKEFAPIKQRFSQMLYKFFPSCNLESVYKMFLATQGIDYKENKQIRYDDIAPLLLIQDYLFGLRNDYNYKYVIIDEMQDFTPCHFYLFNKLFRCPRLLLGDINQCIEKNLTKEYLPLLAKLTKSDVFSLDKTYRSTKQIAEFSQSIINLKNIQNMCREGEKPAVIKTKNTAQSIIDEISNSSNDFKHIAIICKTQKEQNKLFQELKDFIPVEKLDEASTLSPKIVITCATTSKGVEFDYVIIPYCNKENYKDNLDKNLLYIACTRALHKLTIYHNSTKSPFLKNT